MAPAQPKPSRRGFMLGAAAAGAAATAVATLPKVPASQPAVSEPLAPPERGGGYRESEHVKRYYQTTRI